MNPVDATPGNRGGQPRGATHRIKQDGPRTHRGRSKPAGAGLRTGEAPL